MPRHECAVDGHDYQPLEGGCAVCRFCCDYVSPPGKIKYVPITITPVQLCLSLISFLHRAVYFEITLCLSSDFSYSSATFLEIGPGELLCLGLLVLLFVVVAAVVVSFIIYLLNYPSFSLPRPIHSFSCHVCSFSFHVCLF